MSHSNTKSPTTLGCSDPLGNVFEESGKAFDVQEHFQNFWNKQTCRSWNDELYPQERECFIKPNYSCVLPFLARIYIHISGYKCTIEIVWGKV